MTNPILPVQAESEDLPLHQITDHDQRILDRLLTQLKEKPVLAAFLGTYSKVLQELEDTFWDLKVKRTLDVAMAAQLDVIGHILKEPRGPLDDDDYRAVLRIKVRVLKSAGTAEQVMQIARLVLGSTGFDYREWFPAAETVEVMSTPVFELALLARFLRQAKSGGVRLDVWVPATAPKVTLRFTSVTSGGGTGTASGVTAGGDNGDAGGVI